MQATEATIGLRNSGPRNRVKSKEISNSYSSAVPGGEPNTERGRLKPSVLILYHVTEILKSECVRAKIQSSGARNSEKSEETTNSCSGTLPDGDREIEAKSAMYQFQTTSIPEPEFCQCSIASPRY
jgi:hypothetical protein